MNVLIWTKTSVFKESVTNETNLPMLNYYSSLGPQFFIIKAQPYFPPGIAF